MVALVLTMAVMTVAFSITKNGATLFAKNVSINLSHVYTHEAIDRIALDARQSVIKPIVTGSGANVQFEIVAAGPFLLSGSYVASATSVTLTATTAMPTFISGSGWRVLVPGWTIDALATGISTSGTTMTCSLSGTLGTSVGGGASAVVPVYIGLAVTYSVASNYYVSSSGTIPISSTSLIRSDGRGYSHVLVSNVLTPLPFTLPTSDLKLLAIHLGATNSDYCNRAFVSSDILYNSVSVAYRGALYITGTNS